MPTETITEPDGRVTEMFDLPTDEATLLRLFRILFEEHYRDIVFGPCIEGAVFEIRVDQPGVLTVLDGYLTVDFRSWHFHLCIGEHRGTRAAADPAALARHRRVKRAALYRSRGKSCLPMSWGLRLWNGQDEQMITVFLPNPYLDQDQKVCKEPNWTRLQLWNELRRDFLGLDEDDSDQARG